MKEKYYRTEIIITAFDEKNVITTSGPAESSNYNPEDKIIEDVGGEPFDL